MYFVDIFFDIFFFLIFLLFVLNLWKLNSNTEFIIRYLISILINSVNSLVLWINSRIRDAMNLDCTLCFWTSNHEYRVCLIPSVPNTEYLWVSMTRYSFVVHKPSLKSRMFGIHHSVSRFRHFICLMRLRYSFVWFFFVLSDNFEYRMWNTETKIWYSHLVFGILSLA